MLVCVKEFTQRLQKNTNQLEGKNLELNRAHRQTRTSFTIAQEIGALPDINGVAVYLIRKPKSVLKKLFDEKGENRL